jgi:phosphatidylserine/phosphatidylglycerophosphate/cardiolipin synthase-like enzyme
MTVDGSYGTIGSYNLQPRSQRYVMEITLNFSDRQAVAELDAAFRADIAAAKHAKRLRTLAFPTCPSRA